MLAITNPVCNKPSNYRNVRGSRFSVVSNSRYFINKPISFNFCGFRVCLSKKEGKMITLDMVDVQNISEYVISNPYDVEARFGLADALENADLDDQAFILRTVTELGRWPTPERRAEIEPRMTQLLNEGVEPFPLYKKLILEGAVELDLAVIPPGGFMMGSPEDEPNRFEEEHYHPVELTHGIYMSKYTITQEQYFSVTGQDPSHFKGPKRPVETVSWDDANAFCKQLTEKYCTKENGLDGWEAMLPTEAQWEYSCKAGTTTPYHYGKELTPKMANIYDKDKKVAETCDVGMYKPNAFGLYDMHGNVWEWCRDYYSKDAYLPGNRVEEP